MRISLRPKRLRLSLALGASSTVWQQESETGWPDKISRCSVFLFAKSDNCNQEATQRPCIWIPVATGQTPFPLGPTWRLQAREAFPSLPHTSVGPGHLQATLPSAVSLKACLFQTRGSSYEPGRASFKGMCSGQNKGPKRYPDPNPQNVGTSPAKGNLQV